MQQLIVSVDQLSPDENNPRDITPESVADLVASIRQHGVRVPLEVRQNGSAETFIVTAGHRRLVACEILAGEGFEAEIPVIVREGESEQQTAIAQLVENLQRLDLDPIEEARGYARLVDSFQFKQKDIAGAVGRDASHVSKRLALLSLPESAQLAIRTGNLTIDDGVLLAKVEDEEALQVLSSKAAKGDLPRWELNQILKMQDAEKQRRKLVRKVEKLGHTVLSDEDLEEEPPAGKVYRYAYDRQVWEEELDQLKLPRGAAGVVVTHGGRVVPVVLEKAGAKDTTGDSATTAEDRKELAARKAAKTRAMGKHRREEFARLLEAKSRVATAEDVFARMALATCNVQPRKDAYKLLVAAGVTPAEIPLVDITWVDNQRVETPKVDEETGEVLTQQDADATLWAEFEAGGQRRARMLLALSMALAEVNSYAREAELSPSYLEILQLAGYEPFDGELWESTVASSTIEDEAAGE